MNFYSFQNTPQFNTYYPVSYPAQTTQFPTYQHVNATPQYHSLPTQTPTPTPTTFTGFSPITSFVNNIPTPLPNTTTSPSYIYQPSTIQSAPTFSQLSPQPLQYPTFQWPQQFNSTLQPIVNTATPLDSVTQKIRSYSAPTRSLDSPQNIFPNSEIITDNDDGKRRFSLYDQPTWAKTEIMANQTVTTGYAPSYALPSPIPNTIERNITAIPSAREKGQLLEMENTQMRTEMVRLKQEIQSVKDELAMLREELRSSDRTSPRTVSPAPESSRSYTSNVGYNYNNDSARGVPTNGRYDEYTPTTLTFTPRPDNQRSNSPQLMVSGPDEHHSNKPSMAEAARTQTSWNTQPANITTTTTTTNGWPVNPPPSPTVVNQQNGNHSIGPPVVSTASTAIKTSSSRQNRKHTPTQEHNNESLPPPQGLVSASSTTTQSTLGIPSRISPRKSRDPTPRQVPPTKGVHH